MQNSIPAPLSFTQQPQLIQLYAVVPMSPQVLTHQQNMMLNLQNLNTAGIQSPQIIDMENLSAMSGISLADLHQMTDMEL